MKAIAPAAPTPIAAATSSPRAISPRAFLSGYCSTAICTKKKSARSEGRGSSGWRSKARLPLLLLRNAELVGGHFRHAGFVDDPGVGDDGGPHRVVGRFARHRREQHRAALGVGLELFRMRDA